MATDEWNKYLARSTKRNAIYVNEVNFRQRLKDRENVVFLRRGNIDVRITDIKDGHAKSTVYHDTTELTQAVSDVTALKNADMRIVSIYSENSITPLNITSGLMCHILGGHDVHPDFLQVVLSFGEQPHIAEAGCSNYSYTSEKKSRTSHFSYKMNYAEEKLRNSMNPWSFRHTGVYHQHTPQLDFFILLHPNQNSVLETRLLDRFGIDVSKVSSTSSEPRISSFKEDLNSLHFMVLSSFLHNWRWYLRYLGEKLNDINDEAMTTAAEEADSKESFEIVKKLRNVNDFALQAQACCTSNLDVVQKLKGGLVEGFQESNGLHSLESALEGYIGSCDALIPRIRNTIDLVGYTLTLHNQMETAQVDKELRDITEKLNNVTKELKDLQTDSLDDSATVKIITLVTAIYLPGSFVTGVYGTNFFGFGQGPGQGSAHIAIANDFWIFIATWLSLTGITGFLYLLIKHRSKRQSNKDSSNA